MYFTVTVTKIEQVDRIGRMAHFHVDTGAIQRLESTGRYASMKNSRNASMKNSRTGKVSQVPRLMDVSGVTKWVERGEVFEGETAAFFVGADVQEGDSFTEAAAE